MTTSPYMLEKPVDETPLRPTWRKPPRLLRQRIGVASPTGVGGRGSAPSIPLPRLMCSRWTGSCFHEGVEITPPAGCPPLEAPRSDPSSGLRPIGSTSPPASLDDGLPAQSAFLRRIAHDIASPTGVATTALEELASSQVARPELVAMARRGLRRLLRLSEQIALAGEVAAGPLERECALEDGRTLARLALDDALAIDGRRDVIASLHVPDACLPVHVDRRLVVSVLREIVGNALRLATSRVRVDVEAGLGRVLFRVEDDGPGFSDEALAILEGRAPAVSSTRRLGLSLSIAIAVVSAHAGSIAVEASTLPPGRRGRRGAAVIVAIPGGGAS
jgi:signal transduction histidine kinase